MRYVLIGAAKQAARNIPGRRSETPIDAGNDGAGQEVK